jgi:5-formyltetrahydrofolate cyclo-ligase
VGDVPPSTRRTPSIQLPIQHLAVASRPIGMSSWPDSPKTLRRTLRTARRALSGALQRSHARAVAMRLGREQAFLRARHVGLYWPADGELDALAVIALPQARGKRWRLPVLCPHPQPRLWFLDYQPGEPTRPNRFRIPEPARRNHRLRLARSLDVLLLPLVGFDTNCRRLGMGAGYYDRTLGYLLHCNHWRRPRLIGLAHECQRVDGLPAQPWDVPLDLVVTERRVYRCGVLDQN